MNDMSKSDMRHDQKVWSRDLGVGDWARSIRERSGADLARDRARAIIAFEQAIEKRTRELTAGAPPEFNLAPTKELVRQAFLLGYDVVKPDADSPKPA